MIRIPRSSSLCWMLISAFLLGSLSIVQAQSTGSISGTVVAQETGETLIGVNVRIEDTSIGAATDIDGSYRLRNVSPGSYTLVFSYIGYQRKNVESVKVAADSAATVNVSLASESVEMDEVTVQARAIRNTEAILLKDRQKAAAMSNAISAEAMSRTGASTASEAMKKVTGASVLDGKYVQIRGLGGRYVNTQLNGAPLPSADPNQNSVPLDLFPSGLLDNIVTKKTFTPDEPGDFTGGSVNIGTKSYPESFILSLSSSISHNTQVGIGDDMLSFQGGSVGAFGMNGYGHALPDAVSGGRDIPSLGEARRSAESAQRLDDVTKAFGNVMSPSMRPAPISASYKFSSGGQTDFLGRQLGVIASINYSRSADGYRDGQAARYILPGNVAETDSLSPNFQLSDISGTDEVLWGGMASLNYKLLPRHRLSLNYMRNHSAASEARFLSGSLPRDLTAEGATYQTRTLHYTERDIRSYQAKGRHNFGGNFSPTLEWNSTLATTSQQEPDLRYFSSNYTPFSYGGTPDTVFVIRPSIYSLPARYFRDLEEENWSSEASLTIPFMQWSGLRSTVKMGGSYSDKTRTFRERQFEYHQDAINFNDVRGRTAVFWSDENLGIMENESREGFWRFGNYINEQSSLGDSYDGDQQIYAGFGMVDMPLVRDLRLIAGIRYEGTDMVTTSLDTTKDDGILDTNDWLPSANLVYSISDRMNLRGAYGRTLARPTFREMAPYSSFAFVNDFIFTGNPDLRRTLVHNYDLRWEWFMRPGEILAVSGFFKDFSNPIERVILNTNGEIRYQNVSHARVYGLELEVSKKLGQLSPVLEYLQFGANLTLTHSETQIAPSELEIIRAFDPDADDTRPMQGESPYVVNVDLSYSNPNTGTDIGAYYHVFGERQVSVSLGGTPDLYEQPRHQIDINLSQKLWGGFSASASVSNLLGEPYRAVHSYKGVDYVGQGYARGRSISLGISYDI